jgi:hypothetical protein
MIHSIITGIVLLLILAAAWSGLISKRAVAAFIANNAQIVNITPKGRATYLADQAVTFTSRYLICSRDPAGADYILVAGQGSIPFGVVPDMTPTIDTAPSDYPLPVNILGMNEDTERMIASSAIAIDQLITTDASGQVRAVPAAAGTYWVIGKCKVPTVTGAGDQVEVIPCFPYQLNIAQTV